MPIVFDLQSLFWCIAGIVGSSIVSIYISWLFSGRYSLVADIVTVPSCCSKFSKNAEITVEKGFDAYDTYVVLENHGNQSLQMSDFAPLNMPHIQIVEGKLQRREKPYYVLPNPDPFAMYNNVRLSDNGDKTINITFDQLKQKQNIEIVVHSLIALNRQSRIKLSVAATLRNGRFISMKQLRAQRALIQMLVSAILLLVILRLPMIPDATKLTVMIALAIWWPLSVKLVDLVSYYGIRKKIVFRR